jgi:predicted amidohydrolase YtcJ
MRRPLWPLAFAIMFSGCNRTTAPPPADLVLMNGKLATFDPARPEATALAARGGRIVATGSDAQIQPLIGPKTEVLRLGGQLAIPGFIESHGHIRNLGLLRIRLDLTKTHSWEEVVERVRAAAAQAKPGSWIFGRGWHQEKWDHKPAGMIEGYPTREALNEAAPANPVLLRHMSGHAAIANAAALSAAGIERKTPNPPGGRIVRDAAGNATGVLIETAADLVLASMEAELARRSRDEIDAEMFHMVDIVQDECLAKGVTTFEDAGSPFSTIDQLKTMAKAGRLKMRLWVMVRDENALLATRLPAYRVTGAGGGFLTIRAIKRQMDGALGSRGAWLLAPYSDDSRTSGLNTEPVADIEETARIAIENGFQLCVHAIGDRANRETLDLFWRRFEGEEFFPLEKLRIAICGSVGRGVPWRRVHRP